MDESRVTVLMADDDHDDCLLTELALRQVSPSVDLRFVRDGLELLAYLRHEGAFAARALPPPSVILLDLNMPRLDGLQALAEIKADPALRACPVVVFSTSHAETDIDRSYALGASAFLTKPMSFDGFADSFKRLADFYLDVAALPHAPA